MTFADLKTHVAQETGLDTTTDATLLGTWVNAAYKQVNGINNWPWLLKNSTIVTIADITTGTVSINAASTALTFTSGPAPSIANQWMIQFTGVSNDWYFISAHNAGATSATLATAFNGSVNISGASYLLRKVFYSLATDTDRIVDARQARTDTKLGAIDIRTFDRYLPNPDATGDPCFYYLAGMTPTTNIWQVGLYPVPSTAENIQMRYLQSPASLTGTDLPIMPEKFHDIIVYGALWMFGHAYIDDTRIQAAKARYDQALSDMKQNYNPIPDQSLVIQTWDSRPPRILGQLLYPPNFQQWS